MKIKDLKLKNKELVALMKERDIRFKSALQKFAVAPAGMAEYIEWHKTSNIGSRNLSREYRHQHIAYCLLRGKNYECIESNVKANNEPNWTMIENIIEEYGDTLVSIENNNP